MEKRKNVKKKKNVDTEMEICNRCEGKGPINGRILAVDEETYNQMHCEKKKINSRMRLDLSMNV